MGPKALKLGSFDKHSAYSSRGFECRCVVLNCFTVIIHVVVL